MISSFVVKGQKEATKIVFALVLDALACHCYTLQMIHCIVWKGECRL